MLPAKKMAEEQKKAMSFLDHLEALRWHLMRSVVVVVALAIVLFCYNDFVFGTVIFGPKHDDFLTYRAIRWLFARLGIHTDFHAIKFELINIDLSGQFSMHIWVSFMGALVVGIPYILWELWRFIKPALHKKELRYARWFVFYASLLFLTGVFFCYYIVVPLTVSFLGGYQVTAEVTNTITMDSFISTVTTLTLITGIIFELPILAYFLTRFGILSSAFMKKYRRHAVVVILIVAAVMSPSSDIPTLLVVSLPLYLLFEVSIFVAKFVERKRKEI